MVIRYEGPHANGMPEMYFAAAILSSDPVLNSTTAIVTDGRYSARCAVRASDMSPPRHWTEGRSR
jgi:dihydroxyacid dehydratase/phosphogluconate dehydratase